MYFPHSFLQGGCPDDEDLLFLGDRGNEWTISMWYCYTKWFIEYWWVVGMKAFFMPMILFVTIFKHPFNLILNGLQSYNVQIDKVVWKNGKNAV